MICCLIKIQCLIKNSLKLCWHYNKLYSKCGFKDKKLAAREFLNYVYDPTMCDLINITDKALNSFLNTFIHEDIRVRREIYNVLHTSLNRIINECVSKCNNTLNAVISTKEILA